MFERCFLCCKSTVITAFFIAFSSIAHSEDDGVIEEVIVTGSYIKGSPQDAELPIDVLTEEDLLQQGSPSLGEMIRNLGVTSANLAETNQFTTSGQANEGMITVNLRGLGAARTLVLRKWREYSILALPSPERKKRLLPHLFKKYWRGDYYHYYYYSYHY